LTRKGRKLEVWGAVRPAQFAKLDTGNPQSVLVQFEAGSKGAFTTIATVPITNSRGYFDVHLAFPSGGTVRLAWAYPARDPRLGSGTVFSRSQKITVR
jgi:hypothetical protein